MHRNQIIAILIVLVFAGTFMYRHEIKSFVKHSIFADLKIGQEYKVDRITVIKGDEFAIMTKGYLYNIKLYNSHAVEDARDEVADILHLSSGVIMIVREINVKDIYADLYLIKDGIRFNLSSFLKEKGLIFRN